MTPRNQRRYVELLRRRAHDAMADVEVLLAAGRYRAVLSRAYYAMLYGAQAVLATQDVFRRRHSAVHVAFNQLFAGAGKVPSETHGWLVAAFALRQLADYDPEAEALRGQADAALTQARSFLEALEPYLAAWLSRAPQS